ncbi:Alpha/Beta hydrolase protein [Entophlyctis helioformis]|nr:Alpha/Beta hydrolase protein [Entophlyctis helioformis]
MQGLQVGPPSVTPAHCPLYPAVEPFKTELLPVSPVHTLYLEQSGNPNGKPVVYLHGGPGGGTSASDRCYFDPAVYRIVVFDQRGSGKSTPSAELDGNDTWSLVADIERSGAHLGIDKWVVFGGSWGSTLALVYAETHPAVVKALILRGIFMLRPSEIKWFYQEGASHLFPDYWDGYLEPIPVEERGDMIKAYYKRLTSPDENVRLTAAKAWSKWECATSKLLVDKEMIAKVDDDVWSLAFARIECHYFVNNGFFESDSWILDNVDKIRHIPAIIVQGRYDVVCPMRSAWDLSKAWPEAKLIVTPDAGHSAREIGNTSRLVEAADAFRTL